MLLAKVFFTERPQSSFFLFACKYEPNIVVVPHEARHTHVKLVVQTRQFRVEIVLVQLISDTARKGTKEKKEPKTRIEKPRKKE